MRPICSFVIFLLLASLAPRALHAQGSAGIGVEIRNFPAATTRAVIFVDSALTADCAGTYDYTTRQCGAGTFRAYRTIAGAAAAAVAGDTVVFRRGTFSERFEPRNSGTAARPILYSTSIGERVVITGDTLSPAIWIYQREYISILGVAVVNVQRWLAALGSRHIVIRSCTFTGASDPFGSSKTGLFFQRSDSNMILNCTIDNSNQDNLALVQSNHNLVQGNRFTRASHTLWTIKCGNYNVLRNNYFENSEQKIGEIYDCDAVGYGDFGFDKTTSFDDTKYNVVEANVFALTSTPINASPYAGIQHAGQHCIIRWNAFFHCIGPPIDLTLYADEARNDYGNRIYNNDFYDNEFGGISISPVTGAGYAFHDNVCKNNIFFRNRFTQYDTRWDWYNTLNGKPVQIISGRYADILFERNDIFNATRDELWTIMYGDRTSSTNPPPQTLTWWQSNDSAMFKSNLQTDPLFG